MRIQNNVWSLILALVSIYGCNKAEDNNSDNTPVKSCLVTSIRYDSLTEYKYTYDEQRRMLMVADEHYIGGERKYVYGPASVKVDNRSITLNHKGIMVSCFIADAPSDRQVSYVYDASDCLIQRTEKSTKGVFIHTYSWKAGNLVKTVGVNDKTKDTISVFESTYYEDKPNVLANHEKLQTFTGTQSRNLVKTTIGIFEGYSNKQIQNYVYEFGADGKLSKVMMSGKSLMGGDMMRNESYKWNCD